MQSTWQIVAISALSLSACAKHAQKAKPTTGVPEVDAVISGAQPDTDTSGGGGGAGSVSPLPVSFLPKAVKAAPAESTTSTTTVPPPTSSIPTLHVNAGPDATWRAPTPLAGALADATGVSFLWTRASGPGAVSFDDATSLTATPTFAADGVYVLHLAATGASLAGGDDVQITWDTTPPTVSAGADRRGNGPTALAGTATDTTALTLAWSVVSGPGACTWQNAAAAATTVSCNTDGAYVLRLTATDAAGNTASDDAALDWDAHPPVVHAGADVEDATGPVTMAATATDAAPMTYAWQKMTGPGAIVFSDPTALNPVVSATVDGRYVLRFTATDAFGNAAAGELSFEWISFDTRLLFSGPGRYDFDAGHVEMHNGVASLSTASVISNVDSAGAFHAAGATLNNVAWNNGLGGLALDAAGLAAQTGTYTSPALDLGGPTDVKVLRWANDIPGPYQRDLPGNGGADPLAWGAEGISEMSDLVMLFHFNEDAGSRALVDSSGSLNLVGQAPKATCTGSGCPKLNYRGRIGRGAEFDGTDDYMTIPDDPSNRVDGSVSIAVWMKVEDVGFNYIIEKGDSDACDNYALYMFGGQAGFEMSQGFSGPGSCNGSWAGWNETAPPLSTGTWYHIAVVYDDAAHSITFYRNGVVSGQFTNIAEHITPSDRPVRIGRQWWGGTTQNAGFFHGGMDELGVWRKALAASDIEKYYARGRYRLDMQVRGCQDSGCSTATAWLGPDGGTNSAFYTYYLADGSAVQELPVLGVDQQNYLQFRATLSAPNTATSPVLTSVGASAFDTSNPTVTLLDPIRPFTTLTGFSEIVDSDHVGDVKYQVSNDGQSWRFHNGSAWVAAGNTISDANSASDVSLHVGTIATDLGAGPFYFRAFLNRNPGSGFIRLRGVRVTGTMQH